MKIYAIVPLAALAAGILIGWSLPRHETSGRTGQPGKANPRFAVDSSGSDTENETNFRTGNRPQTGVDGEVVRVPLAQVREILKGRFGKSNFVWVTGELANVLPFLGATPGEAEKLTADFNEAMAEISALELQHVRVREATPYKIILDTRAMEPAGERVASNVRQRIIERLGPGRGGALIDSIAWENIYPWSGDITFEITRTEYGELRAVRNNVQGGVNAGMNASEFPDDGEPIPAARLFHGGNWAALLGGHTLLPPPNGAGP